MKPAKPTILFLDDPGRKSLGPKDSLEIAASGCVAIHESSVEAALELFSTRKFDVLISNSPNLALMEGARKKNLNIINILVAQDSMLKYAIELEMRDVELLDHVIANLNLEWTLAEISVTLQKIIRQDIFGIEKYLNQAATVHTMTINGSSSRDTCNSQVTKWTEQCGFNKNISRLAHGICEELIMNAIFDAPAAAGRSNYASLERSQARELLPEERGTLRYGADDRLVAISVSDPFGAFLRDTWFNYSRKILKRNDSDLIDMKSGGAGLGLFKILYGSHGVVCNVEPNKITEVIALISVNQPIRDFDHMPRSIHYFNTVSHSHTS